MKDKVVLITGANSGTGLWTSIELAKLGAHVVMLCRDESRGLAAQEEIKRLSGSNNVDLMLCDLGSLQSVREFAKLFLDNYSQLDVLVNNAGVILPKRHTTSDGIELQFGVNHLGHFLLTELLLGLMIKSAPARIIVVSSGAHKIGKINFDDVGLVNGWNMIRAYSQSKLANVIFTNELSRRLDGTGVVANSLHPGTIKSNFAVNRDTGFGSGIMHLLQPFFQSAQKASETAVYLASSDEVEGVSGKYFYKMKEAKTSKLAKDERIAKRLWTLSEAMTSE